MGTTDAELHPFRLAAEQLQEMLDSLDAAPLSERKHPRRSERKPFRSASVEIQIIESHSAPAGNSFQVVTRNLSAHGLAFLHRNMIAIDQRLRVRIPLLDDRHVELLARVARCRYVGDMVHEIGVEFLSESKISSS